MRSRVVRHLHGFQNHHYVPRANDGTRLNELLNDGGLKRGTDGVVLHGCILR
jgi:hypothetical protein